MNPILQEMSDERQRRYDDAKKDLLQAINSFSQVDDAQKNQLCLEFLRARAVLTLYSAMRQNYG